ncbi:MAG: hypothetical protein KDD67_01515 [Ignavibacteriae bacterium]|nr:hypothetical protein [Ignavibacteriota bacterium]MCB9215504.1 hypothetical protein [Ignavibacteria bacterium]
MVRFQLRHIVLLFSFSLLLHQVDARGQERRTDPIFGAFISYEYGLPLALERSPGAVEWCAFCDGTGTSYDHRGRFGAFLQLSNTTDIRLSLGISSGEFTSTSYVAPLIDPETSSTTQTDRFFTVSSLVANIEGGLQLKGEVFDHLSVGFGPWLSYWLFSRFVQRESIVSPAEITFPGTTERTRIVNEGDLLGSGPISFGGTLSTSYEFLLFGHLHIVPELYTRIDAWGLVNGLGIRSLSVGTALSFNQQPPQPIEPPLSLLPLQPIPPPPPTLPYLSADIDLYALDNSGNNVEVIEPLPRRTGYLRHTPPEQEWVVDDYVLPSIGITPQIRAEAGIRSWSLSIRRENQEIAYITSADPDQSLNLNLKLSEENVAQKLMAELIVEDSTGAITVARDYLPLVKRKDEVSGEPILNQIEHQWIFNTPEENVGTALRAANVPEQLVELLSTSVDEVFIFPGSDSVEVRRYAETLQRYLQEKFPSLTVAIETDPNQINLLPGESLPSRSLLLFFRNSQE